MCDQPYLAHESIRQLIEANLLHKDYYAAVDDYNSAVIHGIIKIASKMGISTIQSYQGAKIFEAIGLKSDLSIVILPIQSAVSVESELRRLQKIILHSIQRPLIRWDLL